MKITKLTGILLFFIIATSLQAQNKLTLERYAVLKGDVLRVGDEYTGKVDGSPYYLENFQTGYLRISKNEPLAAKVRYDIVKEQMQISLGSENYKVIENTIVVDLNKKRFKFFPYKWEGENLYGYFEFLSEAKENQPVLVLRKHFKEIKTGTRSQARGFSPKFEDETKIFLKFENAKMAVESESRKKRFLELFPENHQKQLEEFIDGNNLSPRKTEDLISIADFYNKTFK